MSPPRNRHFLEAILEAGESAADLLTDNEAVRAVPVVGTALRLLKGVDDLRDRALAAKLERFFRDPALQSERARRKLRDGISDDPEEAAKVGETLFLVLEKVTDLQKPGLLARVFLAYLDGEIRADDLRRLAHAMDFAFTDDLLSLEGWQEGAHVGYGSDWKRPLVGAGLAEVVGASGGHEVHYQLTALGRTLYRVLWHARVASA